MSTQQPVWKCIGHIGDVDPIAHGGGFVYEDTTGVYAHEVTLFQPESDESWDETKGKTPLKTYRFILERDSEKEWWYSKLSDIASYVGRTLAELHADAKSDNMLTRAHLYADLVSYHGVENFDSYPVETTEDEAYQTYAAEMKQSYGVLISSVGKPTEEPV